MCEEDEIHSSEYDEGKRHHGFPITMVFQPVSRDKKHKFYEHPEAYANDKAPSNFAMGDEDVNDQNMKVTRKVDRQRSLQVLTHPTADDVKRLQVHSKASCTKLYIDRRKKWVHEIYHEQYKVPCKGSRVYHGHVFDKSNGTAEEARWVKVRFVADGEVLLCMLPEEVRHKWWFWGHVGKDGGTLEGVKERTFEELKEWKDRRAEARHAVWKAEQAKKPKVASKVQRTETNKANKNNRQTRKSGRDALGRKKGK